MQLHQVNSSEEIKPVGDVGASNVRSAPVMLGPEEFSNAYRDEVLALLKPARHRERSTWMVAGALVVGFGLGWAGSFGWHSPASISAFIVTDTPSPRSAEARSGPKSEAARKTLSTLAPRIPSGVSQLSGGGGTSAAKPLAASSGAAVDTLSTPFPAIQGDPTPTGSIARIAPAPETRPTTIEGWTVLDVRGATAVLGGPDGVRMATRGDTVPGIGRVDSIVRWGNRWIVATDSGLIATP